MILYYDWLVHLDTKMIQKQELLTVFSTLNLLERSHPLFRAT